MYIYIYRIYVYNFYICDVIGWWFEVAGIHVGCGIYAFDPTDHTHTHIVDLGSITEGLCILGLFRSHPPEGSTWYWAKPLSRRRLPTQNILPSKWLMGNGSSYDPMDECLALVSRSTMHTESVLISQPVFASQLISWIPWFCAQTCEVDVVWKAFSGYLCITFEGSQ